MLDELQELDYPLDVTVVVTTLVEFPQLSLIVMKRVALRP